MTTPIVLAIALGGAVGAVARWATTLLAAGTLGPQWPVGTFVANLLGCLLLGWLRPWSEGAAPAWLVAGLGIGFCGAYTTFSTFALDAVALAREQGVRAAGLYVAFSVVGGIACVVLAQYLRTRT